MKVLNFGSLNLDFVYQVDHMVSPGETLASSQMQIFCGGKGLNQSIALAKAGAEVYHAGCIGEDGRLLVEALEKEGVRTDYVKTLEEKTGHAIIQVDRNGQNCILLYGGANRAQTEEYIDQVLAGFDAGDMIILQNEINRLDYIIDQAYERDMIIVLNPSPFDENLADCDLNKVSIFLINEVEGCQITGENEPEKILEKLAETYPDARVVLTLGSEGSVYQENGCCIRQNIYRVEAVDTTAAGDTFTGYFVASLLEGLDIGDCMDLAAKASALSVTRQGASPSIPLRQEVLDWEF